MKIAVIGAGAWGTALASLFARSSEVTLYSGNHDLVHSIEQRRRIDAIYRE